ncbi:methylamine utilization protein MauJ [Oceanidesulfovibrio marinus]|uniref:methylamine utilization protein MauJ n=1 Tax=Oceanidesulfovibrio marinus TaxID=370038 RepID=UPI001182BAAB|nr:methylamine utilization protein MauJ [Oceanidesulfovibrio marinus]
MLAKHLQSLLDELCEKGELATTAYGDIEKRFLSLRAHGCLPKGRENRAIPLTNEQIAYAILGLVTSTPNYAGSSANCLKQLLPVGGSGRAFAGADTFLQALVRILTDRSTQEAIATVRISTAESGINSPGFATIFYDEAGNRKATHYVRKEAASLLQPGAEERYDPDQRYALFSREVTFSRRFFARLSQRVAEARKYPLPPPEDSSEYDTEEAEKKRLERLGATNRSRFFNIGVETHAVWPKEETLISFDKYRLVLMPMTKDCMQSISIDLHENKLTDEEARTVINRFLSLLAWCDDQLAIAQCGWSGNPVPVPVPRRRGAWAPTSCWPFGRSIPDDKEICRALAFYREARNAELNYMVSHAVLTYYKIIEIGFPEMGQKEKKKRFHWIEDNLLLLENVHLPELKTFQEECHRRDQQASEYIHEACRIAVAHATPGRTAPSDPDDAQELLRLHVATGVMRLLARRFIQNELGVSDSLFCDNPKDS